MFHTLSGTGIDPKDTPETCEISLDVVGESTEDVLPLPVILSEFTTKFSLS